MHPLETPVPKKRVKEEENGRKIGYETTIVQMTFFDQQEQNKMSKRNSLKDGNSLYIDMSRRVTVATRTKRGSGRW